MSKILELRNILSSVVDEKIEIESFSPVRTRMSSDNNFKMVDDENLNIGEELHS